jgi:hypothetical protein
MIACSRNTQTLIGLSLMAVMLATRFHHFGDALHLPDASWALFFLAGFYLSPLWLAALMVQAVAIDVAAVGWMGVSGYCLTPAYAALQVAHLALWGGGRLAARQHADVAGLARMAGIALASAGVAFVLSNGSFYWFGGRVADTSLAQFGQTFVDYGPRFVAAMMLYLAVAALLHALLSHLGHGRPAGMAGGRG